MRWMGSLLIFFGSFTWSAKGIISYNAQKENLKRMKRRACIHLAPKDSDLSHHRSSLPSFQLDDAVKHRTLLYVSIGREGKKEFIY